MDKRKNVYIGEMEPQYMKEAIAKYYSRFQPKKREWHSAASWQKFYAERELAEWNRQQRLAGVNVASPEYQSKYMELASKISKARVLEYG